MGSSGLAGAQPATCADRARAACPGAWARHVAHGAGAEVSTTSCELTAGCPELVQLYTAAWVRAPGLSWTCLRYIVVFAAGTCPMRPHDAAPVGILMSSWWYVIGLCTQALQCEAQYRCTSFIVAAGCHDSFMGPTAAHPHCENQRRPTPDTRVVRSDNRHCDRVCAHANIAYSEYRPALLA
jgi:hypothetical protein